MCVQIIYYNMYWETLFQDVRRDATDGTNIFYGIHKMFSLNWTGFLQNSLVYIPYLINVFIVIHKEEKYIYIIYIHELAEF